MSDGNGSIPVGDIEFYDRYEALLGAGDYSISAQQVVDSTDSGHPLQQTFTADQAFSVVAPRFQLPAADVQSVFPPDNASGAFGQNLPHAVLTQRVLPWERPLGSTLLTYSILATPDPLIAGTTVTLELDVGNGGAAAVDCTSIAVTLPPGLTSGTGIQVQTPSGWTSAQAGDVVTLTPSGAAGTLAPETSIDFVFSAVALASQPATTPVTIAESTSAGAGTATIPLTVFPSGAGAPTNPNLDASPWLAVLLFAEDELIAPPPPPGAGSSTLANPTLVASYPVSQVVGRPNPQTLGPDVVPDAEDETTCQAIDVTPATFTDVTPRLADLRYLAHARQVNVDAKTTAIAIAGGWFSVVVGNRFPAASAEGTRNIAHLVSLEGFAPYLVDEPAWPSGVEQVRLVSLASWSFTCLSETGDFRDLMLNLTANQAQGGDGLRLRLPVTNVPQTPGSPAALAQTALQQGYAALEYETRVGDQTFAWYHGPFVPYPLAPLSGLEPFANAAAATVYDQETGTFDLSYAAAWELGRLLALSDRAYSTSQARARKALRKVVNLVRERTRGSLDGAGLDGVVAHKGVSERLVGWLHAELAERLPRHDRPAPAPAPRQAAAERPATAAAELEQLEADPAVQALLAERARALVDDGPLAPVTDWLGGLRLLEGLPFAHLVPDSRGLPTESIRFFYVDPNYLDALCDGAQSVGVQSTRDARQQRIVRRVLSDAAVASAGARRATALGTPVGEEIGDPVAGLLLRSAAVSGWPGLEVKGFTGDDGATGPIAPVRFDHLAPDVLLVLFPQVPAWIEIDEPKESLAFGIEDDDLVALRYLSGPNAGATTGTNVELTSGYLRGTTRVLQVDSWQAYVLSQDASFQRYWGPGGFAVQMVRAPEQMIFQNQPNTQVTGG